MGNIGNQGKFNNMGDKGKQPKKKTGYEYLLTYKITVPIYDYTVEFCKRWVSKFSRTYDQMEQAARSGSQNIAEGYSQQSLAGYIKLAGVARGSIDQLIESLKRKHEREGGFSENLLQRRLKYRQKGDRGN